MRLVAAALLAFSCLCAAQSEAPVAKPDVKPGDRWVYRRMDYWTNTVIGTYEMRAVFVGRDVIQVVNTVPGKGGESDSTYTSDWNAVSTYFEVFYPNFGLLKFPLQTGKTYKVAFESVFGATREFRVRHDRTAKVLGWEEITVPAGKFRALKVEIAGSFQRLDMSLGGTARNVVWYVPEVKRWVKMMYEDATHLGPSAKSGEELVEFHVQ